MKHGFKAFSREYVPIGRPVKKRVGLMLLLVLVAAKTGRVIEEIP
jgi:hypothetical protein